MSQFQPVPTSHGEITLTVLANLKSPIRFSITESYTETTAWFSLRLHDAFVRFMLFQYVGRIRRFSQLLLGSFLFFCIYMFDLFRKNPQLWLAILLGISAQVIMISSGSRKLFRLQLCNNGSRSGYPKILMLMILLQWALNTTLSVFCLSSKWVGRIPFTIVHMAILAVTTQGMQLISLLTFAFMFCVEVLLRTICCRFGKILHKEPALRETKGFHLATVYRKQDLDKEPVMAETCLICMEEIGEDMIAGTRCGTTHAFHFECLAKHLSAGQTRCPVCGKTINLR